MTVCRPPASRLCRAAHLQTFGAVLIAVSASISFAQAPPSTNNASVDNATESSARDPQADSTAPPRVPPEQRRAVLEEALSLQQRQQLRDALDRYESIPAPLDDDLRAAWLHNQAAAHFKLGDLDRAEQLWDEALLYASPAEQARTEFNRGNVSFARARAGAAEDPRAALEDAQAASQRYLDALQLDPDQVAARENLERSSRLTQQLRELIAQQPPSQSDDNSEPSEDQQSEDQQQSDSQQQDNAQQPNQPDPQRNQDPSDQDPSDQSQSQSQSEDQQQSDSQQQDDPQQNNQQQQNPQQSEAGQPRPQDQQPPQSQPSDPSQDGASESDQQPAPRPADEQSEDEASDDEQSEGQASTSVGAADDDSNDDARRDEQNRLSPERIRELLQQVRDREQERRETLRARAAARAAREKRPVERDW